MADRSTRQRTVRPVAAGWAAAVAALVGLGACGGDDRPTDAEWAERWELERAAYPAADELLAGGDEFCGELLGRLRDDLDALLPTPAPALDGPVREWRDHAETIAFECHDDPDVLAAELDELDVLAAEVDAGLAADAG